MSRGYWLPYQEAFIKDQSKYIIFEKSRQIGISWATSWKLVEKRIETGINAIYVSQKEENAKKFIKDCLYWCKLVYGEEEPYQYTASKITFENGSKIIALSSNPDNLRGYEGDVVLDEFAFNFDQEDLYKAAQPVTMRRGQLIIVSTHNGPTFFNSLCKRAQRGEIDFSHYKTTLPDAVEQGLVEQIIRTDPKSEYKKIRYKDKRHKKFIEDIRSSCTNQTIYEQEYLAKPIGSGSAIVTADMYSKCIQNRPDPDYIPKSTCIAGIDIGVKDLTVISVFEKIWVDDKQFYRLIFCHELKNETDLSRQTQQFKNVVEKYLDVLEYVVIDEGSVGRGPTDELLGEYGGLIKNMSISYKAKCELSEYMRKVFEEGRISVWPETRMEEDICSMVITETAKGTPTYDGRTSYSHCDYFMSMGMAIRESEKESGFYFAVR